MCIIHKWVYITDYHRICKKCGEMQEDGLFSGWKEKTDFTMFIDSAKNLMDEDSRKRVNRSQAKYYVSKESKIDESR